MAASSGLRSAISQTFGALPPTELIFGSSPAMQAVGTKVEKIAGANLSVLIEGESGTGKDVIARLIHQLSPWSNGPWVKINCPAIPAALMESELFGYEKGAFTGANGSKPGRVEMAHRGTLFLDEISELDAGLQSKLLQLLQDGQFCRIGATEDKKAEVRVICATNRVMEDEIKAGRFRRDLYYRINVVNIHLPRLCDRACDIPGFVQYFLDLYNDKYNCRAKPLSDKTMMQLQRYHWPGNIRELENLMRRYVILGSEDILTVGAVPQQSELTALPDIPADGFLPLKKATNQAVRELERKIILRVLQANRWNRKRAAEILEISYRALLYKMKYAGLPSKRGSLNRPVDSAQDD